MGGQRAVMVMVVVAVMAVVTVAAGTILKCDVHCTCREEVDEEKDYNVRCNAATLEGKVTVSESVFTRALISQSHAPNLTIKENYTAYRTHVVVQGSASLTLTFTTDFFTVWRQFTSCSLDVIGADNVIFPEVSPYVPDNSVGHYFAGLGLANVSTNELPVALFSGKHAAGIFLTNSSVGRLPAGMLQGVEFLQYMEIVNSTIGIMEGPMGDDLFRTVPTIIDVRSRPLLLVNSTLGILKRGAVMLQARQDQKIVLEGVSVGRVEPWAVEVEGAGEVVVRQCSLARVETNALLLGQSTWLTLTESWLAMMPGVLTRYSCGDAHHSHHIFGNHFMLLDNVTGLVGLDLQQTAQEAWQQAETSLGTAIHPSCVANNLPSPPSSPLPTPAPWSAVTTQQMVTLLAAGLVTGAIVACLAIVAYTQWCRRGRHPNANQPPPILMSTLTKPEEPVYEEPLPPGRTPTLRGPCSPLPPVPQPSPVLGNPGKATSCGSGPQQSTIRRPNNHYTMD